MTQNLRAKLSTFSSYSHCDTPEAIAEHKELVSVLPTLPPELVELGLATTLYFGKGNSKLMKPVLAAMAGRCPPAAELLRKPPNLSEWCGGMMESAAWPKFTKFYEQIDQMPDVDGARFRMELLLRLFAQRASWMDALRAALERVPSKEIFVALRRAIDARSHESGSNGMEGLHLDLWLEGTLFEGVGQIPSFDWLVLRGRHTNSEHVEELADGRAPFNLSYRVKSPKLANLLPLRHHVAWLRLPEEKVDLAPLVEFDQLKRLNVASVNMPRARELLAKTHPELDICT